MRFNDATIKALPEGKYFDPSTPGFGIRVGKHRRTWIVMRGKQRQLIRLGHYPTMPLSEARTKGKQLLAATLLNHERVTFQEACDTFVDVYLPTKKPSTRYDYKRILSRHFLPTLAGKRLDAITAGMVLGITDELTHTPAVLIQAISLGKSFFKWCIRRHYLSLSPMAAIQAPRPKKRKRVLSDEELKELWQAAHAFGGAYGTIVKLIILTGLRRKECAALQKSWIAKDRITIPAEVTKNSTEFCFPIGPLAIAVLIHTSTFHCVGVWYDRGMKTKKQPKPKLPKHVRLTLRDWEQLRRVAFRMHKPMSELVGALIQKHL